MYAVMWSEHCSYKSSKRHLGRFPTEAPWVLVGPGEGAGVIDVGDGLAVAIRIESHNHPSAVEPYQGAATGVGGIIRDIFSMGARPIALMDPLRFGPLDDAAHALPRSKASSPGISGYGNAVGVPTVGGEVVFDDCYRDNPLVNVLCLGVLPDRPARARRRPRASTTSRCCSAPPPDATASAAPACSRRPASPRAARPSGRRCRSATRSRRSGSSRRASSCSTPASRSACRTSARPGISCAASETAAKTGAGMDVDVARVPKREPGMNARRGDDVGEPGAHARDRHAREPRRGARRSCGRWEIRASVIGRVTDTGRFRVYDGLFDAVGVPGENPPPPLGDDAAGGVVRRAAGRRRAGRRASATARCTTGPAPRPPIAPRVHADDPAPVLAQRFPDGTDLARRAARAARHAQHRRQVVGVPPVRPPAVPQHGGRPGRRRRRCCA